MIAASFFAVEVDTYAPPTSAGDIFEGHGTNFHGAPPSTIGLTESSNTVYVSDLGYRSLESDSVGLRVYPPLVQEAFAIDRSLNLDPTQSAVAAAWGSITLSEQERSFDALVQSTNSDNRGLRILFGQKTRDPSRGYDTDPSYATLQSLYQGLAGPWTLSDTNLLIPIRDASYMMEQPLQQTLYQGTGQYEGDVTLWNKPKPKARGGTAQNPINNITPVQVDAQNLIYQYSDAPGTVVTVYEGGLATYTYAGDVPDLYAGGAPAGQYRTCNARGMFQLGTAPSRAITCDVTGAWPSGATVADAPGIAKRLLLDELGLPPAYVDQVAFDAASAAYPYVSGVYFKDAVQGPDAVNQVLTCIGGKLVPRRNGTLSLLMLRAPSGAPVATFTTENTVSVVPLALPSTLSPPTGRWLVGYQQNYTVQSLADLNPTVAQDRQVWLLNPYRYAGWSSGTILTQWRRPNLPAGLPSVLLAQADAQTVANDLGALWGTRRRLYQVTVPVGVGIQHEIGEQVQLVWPMDDLDNGRLGVIVGDQFRSTDATIALTVLV